MVAALAKRLLRMALLAGVFLTPALAQDHAAPIISYPTSENGGGTGSSAGLLVIMQTLHAMRAQLRSLENQAEITNHKIELLRNQQQSFMADIDRQLRRLTHKGGGGAPAAGSLSTPSGSVPAGPTPPAAPTGGANTPPGGTTPPAAAPPASPPGAANPAGAHSNVTIVPPDTVDTGTATAPAPAVTGAGGAQASYAGAFNALRAGQYTQAVAGFQRFLERYPQDRRDAEAQYWIAETHYIERDYHAARLSFRTLVYAYPQSKRVPNALLKLGYMAKWRGRPDKARAIWQRLMQKYPMSTAAQVARSALAKLSAATSSSASGQP